MTAPSAGTPKRSYRSPLREQQAIATREAILDAAQLLFERDGYVPTTIESIAHEARVSPKTVYLAFVNKSTLLRAVWDRALRGQTDAVPINERPFYRNLLTEPDPVRQIELAAIDACALKERTGPLLRTIRSAAAVDPESAELWELIQSVYYDSQLVILQAVADHGGLRPGLTVERAADIMWTLNHPDVWLLFTAERHWTAAEFHAWFRETLKTQLLG